MEPPAEASWLDTKSCQNALPTYGMCDHFGSVVAVFPTPLGFNLKIACRGTASISAQEKRRLSGRPRYGISRTVSQGIKRVPSLS